MSTENVEKMRSFVEENAKLIFSDADSNVTINLWPWVISGILFMLGWYFCEAMTGPYIVVVSSYPCHHLHSLLPLRPILLRLQGSQLVRPRVWAQ